MPTSTAMSNSKKTKKAKQQAKKEADPKLQERVVKYDTPDVIFCVGDNAMTVDQAKELLGWEDEKAFAARLLAEDDSTPEAKLKYGEFYTLKDEDGVKVRFTKNAANRPFNEAWARALAQDILHSGPGIEEHLRRWQFNMETIIIGRTELVLSGQHRLAALVLAGQAWAGQQKNHWANIWPTEPVLETLLAIGASEQTHVICTLDHTRTRTVADNLYTSQLFTGMDPYVREQACKAADKAVRFLWERTGAFKDVWSGRRTNGEMMDFINRHPKIEDCVRYLMSENIRHKNVDGVWTKPAISGRIDLGTAAGLMYLMGSTTSVGEKYWVFPNGEGDPPREELLDWQLWDRACGYWTQLAKCSTVAGSSELKEVDYGLKKLGGEDGIGKARLDEKLAVIIKGWIHYAKNEKITPKRVELNYDVDPDDGTTILDDYPVVGGVDRGARRRQDKEEKDLKATQEKVAKGTTKDKGKGKTKEEKVEEDIEESDNDEEEQSKDFPLDEEFETNENGLTEEDEEEVNARIERERKLKEQRDKLNERRKAKGQEPIVPSKKK